MMRMPWGLKRLKIRELPLQKIKVGEVFPCVSTFTPGAHPAHYADFNPRPISWGTGDALTVRFLLEKLGSEEPGHLRHCFKRDIIPADNQHILLLDGNFAPIEGVDASNQSAPGRG